MSSSVHVLAGGQHQRAKSRIEALHQASAQGFEGTLRSGRSLVQDFEKVYDATKALREIGVHVVVHFPEPIEAAWKVWLATHEAEQRAQAPLRPDEADRTREDRAIAVANSWPDERQR